MKRQQSKGELLQVYQKEAIDNKERKQQEVKIKIY
jgi:hypothetical protein